MRLTKFHNIHSLSFEAVVDSKPAGVVVGSILAEEDPVDSSHRPVEVVARQVC